MARPGGLGRGLGALIPTGVVSNDEVGLQEIPTASIRPNPQQPIPAPGDSRAEDKHECRGQQQPRHDDIESPFRCREKQQCAGRTSNKAHDEDRAERHPFETREVSAVTP